MKNYFYLKKSYSNDTKVCKDYFEIFVNNILKYKNNEYHVKMYVDKDIKNFISKLELYNDLVNAGLTIHRAVIFVCKPNVIGGLHIDDFDDPRHCSLNLPISGGNLSKILWIKNDQFEMRKKVNLGVPVNASMINPEGWDVIDSATLAKTTLVKTDNWHTVDNRYNPYPRVSLAFRFSNNPTMEHVVKLLTASGLVAGEGFEPPASRL